MKKGILIGIFVSSVLFLGLSVVAKDVKLNPIKPVAKQTAPLTDEQQAILAVRKAKASVVSIVGVIKPATVSTTSVATFSVVAAPQTIAGTGFVWEADGVVVTNNHVIENPALNYYVVLSDGSQHLAKILYLDKFDDIGVLKIDVSNLTPAALGDSNALETGQTVFTIGNSLGIYDSTVSRGVVSALGRALNEGADIDSVNHRLHNLIQTDASINPGNSGGPLVNLAGEVVGMNTLFDNAGAGLGFALPINTIKDAVQQMEQFGKVSRAYLGVQFTSIDPEVKLSYNLGVDEGALITKVDPNGPAGIVKLETNDIILAVNGINLSQTKALDQLIQSFSAGTQVTLKILRNGTTFDLPVVLGQLAQ